MCDKCWTVLFVEASTAPGMKLLRTGTLDVPQEILEAKPAAEGYTKNRPAWCEAVAGAVQKEGGW